MGLVRTWEEVYEVETDEGTKMIRSRIGNEVSVVCRGSIHRGCRSKCICVCHVPTVMIPPETTTILPPQLRSIVGTERENYLKG